MATKKKSPVLQIAKLKVSLEGIQPQIWRRIEVPAAISLAELHSILQIAFGWTNSHLHQFYVGAKCYGMLDEEFDDDVEDERRVHLDQCLRSSPFVYEYDFGDDWKHGIKVEGVFEPEAGVQYPRCTGGKRAGPPEDCGGPWGYDDFLDALRDPDHEEHESMLEWIGGSFDPEAFNPGEVNRNLARLAKRRR